MDESTFQLNLPGFRFHPTEEELLNFYLKSRVGGKKLRGEIIGVLNIYNHDPRELPGLAKIGEREWYFFVPRDRKHGSGGRPNRTTGTGFWKATGSDRKILNILDPKHMLGLKKTLVFYEGRAPRGRKTDWVMNEYRLPDTASMQNELVLCKIYRKATSLKVLEQRAAVEEELKSSPSTPLVESISPCNDMTFKKENEGLIVEEEMHFEASIKGRNCSNLVLPNGKYNLTDFQAPNVSTDWTEDSFWTQWRSPLILDENLFGTVAAHQSCWSIS